MEKGKNVEKVKDMIKEGEEKLKRKIKENYKVKVNKKGDYIIKWKKNYEMGMVEIIEVGDKKEKIEKIV